MTEQCSHAVVLGAGVAGLLAARVLSDSHRVVTVVERDALPNGAEQRRGVPQGRHLHNFLPRGMQVLGELFPGLLDELAAAGAVVDDGDDLSRTYVRVAGYELNPPGRLADPESLAAYQASRPFLEFHLRRRVAALANVTILDGHDVVEPVVAGRAVVGVRIVNRGNGAASVIRAGLVIEATGRAGRAAHALERHGFGTPTEERIPSVGGYSSQLLHIPSGRVPERMAFVNQGSSKPGVLLVAYENDTWMLAVYRPTEEGGAPTELGQMTPIAEQLLPTSLATAVRGATSVGELSVARTTAATWRHYDEMPNLPAGFVVLGDALCHLNPMYGQGMTMAALHVLALRDCLAAGVDDLPRRFYLATAEQILPVWTLNRANDRVPSRTARRRPRIWMQRAALRAASTDIVVAERFLRVRGLVDPPSRLADPALWSRILLVNLRRIFHRRPNRPVRRQTQPSAATNSLVPELVTTRRQRRRCLDASTVTPSPNNSS